MLTEKDPETGKRFQVSAISFFDGILPHHRDLLTHCTRLSEGDKENVLVVVCVEKMQTAPGDDKRILLTPGERTGIIRDMGYTTVVCRQENQSEKLPYVIETLVPGADIWKYEDEIPFFKKNEPKSVNDFFRGRDTAGREKLAGMIEKGMVTEAAGFAGYAFPLEGTVVTGNRIGRALGYPTANLRISDPAKVLPGQGVYTAMVKISGEWHKSMVNVGIRPTLDLENVTVEAHIFDFDRDIYGESISISFLSRIRDEMRFNSLSELKIQLNKDREAAVRMLEDVQAGITAGEYIRMEQDPSDGS